MGSAPKISPIREYIELWLLSRFIESSNVSRYCFSIVPLSLQTFASQEDAESNGFIVTHEGACGTCSSFQDLAVYMAQPSLTDAGIQCAVRGTLNLKEGLRCYEEIGFSPSCAAIWLYNTRHTRHACLALCVAHAISGLPSNLPAPGCELADCIQCDEDLSGPLFKHFGGRTRRKSGLLSTIARPCSSIPHMVHHDPCPAVVGSQEDWEGSSGGASVLHDISTFRINILSMMAMAVLVSSSVW